jgi:hypothetical protein
MRPEAARSTLAGKVSERASPVLMADQYFRHTWNVFVPPFDVPTLEAARERIFEHSLKLEDVRAVAAYGQSSSVGKILEIHQELPGRIHIVLIWKSIGF